MIKAARQRMAYEQQNQREGVRRSHARKKQASIEKEKAEVAKRPANNFFLETARANSRQLPLYSRRV